MEQKVNIKLWFKIVCLLSACFFTAFIVYACINDIDIYEKFCLILLGKLLGGISIIYGLYCCLFAIYVGDDYIKVKKLFKSRIYSISEITKIDYKLVAFGNYTYVVYFGKRKVEISQLLKNKIIVD